MAENELLDGNIGWFRQASPYINAHRGKTMVLCFSGDVLDDASFPTLTHDISLLSSLGIRLVLVHGLRPQIERRLQSASQDSSIVDGLRVTDEFTMDIVREEVGRARIDIEALLSMGLPNTPMSGSHLSVVSGNFVTAQPNGVHQGVDFCHTGIVRQIHTNAIQKQIDSGQIVLLSPIGYSLTGEVFNLQSEAVASQAAIALGAAKLIYITAQSLRDQQGKTIRECTIDGVARLLLKAEQQSQPAPENGVEQHRVVLQEALQACQNNVQRVHLLSHGVPDALLRELFTRDGGGTLITAKNYDTVRPASISDVGGIIELITPLEENGTLVKRSREQLELDIKHFVVCEREGMITACAALILHSMPSDPQAGQMKPHETAAKVHSTANATQTTPAMAEIACVVTHPDYQKMGRAEKLLQHLENMAIGEGVKALYVLTTRTGHWFIEQGFLLADPASLPTERQHALDTNRNSKVLVKRLSASAGSVSAQSSD